VLTTQPIPAAVHAAATGPSLYNTAEALTAVIVIHQVNIDDVAWTYRISNETNSMDTTINGFIK